MNPTGEYREIRSVSHLNSAVMFLSDNGSELLRNKYIFKTSISRRTRKINNTKTIIKKEQKRTIIMHIYNTVAWSQNFIFHILSFTFFLSRSFLATQVVFKIRLCKEFTKSEKM